MPTDARKPIDAARMAAMLNQALAADRSAVETIIGHRVPCNAELAALPAVTVGDDRDGLGPVLSPLGLINAALVDDPEWVVIPTYNRRGELTTFGTRRRRRPLLRPGRSNSDVRTAAGDE